MSAQDVLFSFLIILLVLTVFLVLIRSVTQNPRTFSHHEVPIILALVFFLVMLSLGLKGNIDGGLVGTLYGTWISYAMVMTATRASTLLLYQYIFSTVISRMSIAGLHTANLAWGVITLVLTFPGLITIEQFGGFFLSTGVTNMILDFVVVTYGVVLANSTQVAVSKKKSLIALFSLPYLSCIASAVRVCVSRELDATDLSDSITGPFMAACLESFVALAGFIVACGARPLYRLTTEAQRFFSSRFQRARSEKTEQAEVKIGYHYRNSDKCEPVMIQEHEIPAEGSWLKDQQELQLQLSNAHHHSERIIVCAESGVLRTGTLSVVEEMLGNRGDAKSAQLPPKPPPPSPLPSPPTSPPPPPPCHGREPVTSRGPSPSLPPLPEWI